VLNNAYVALGLECYLRQNHYYKAEQTETATPSYTLVNFSAGTDVMIKKKKVAEVYVTADNLFNRAYQSHLSRLKYTDINVATGRMGVYNMGRNVVMKVVVPLVFETR
jgi:iron complex outermembrane receptor protein